MLRHLRETPHASEYQGSLSIDLTREDIRALISEIGIIPALCAASVEEALFVADSLYRGGVPIIEVSANPVGLDVIPRIVKHIPKMVVGAGSITSLESARRCIEAGARFLSSDMLIPGVIELARRENIAVLPGAFTPTEVLAAWNAGADLVKVVPCNAAGGAAFIQSLKAALRDVALIAAGGVTQQTAFDLVAAGATALGIGKELVPAEAIRTRHAARIQELARRFLNFVDSGRIEAAGRAAGYN
jgi:2-dehydro-3-deoxyphosphogluconate aldolase / (4S)-4-hydroxy-2-oxoglutarate aldolase